MFYNRRVALAHPDALSPEYRLLSFDMTAECHGTQLAGNNIQVVLGAPDQLRVGLEEDVVMWLASHWWVVLRNKFALAPKVAVEVLESVADELSAITARATTARGAETEALTLELFSAKFEATGPDYWP